jgi:hypothetical protein
MKNTKMSHEPCYSRNSRVVSLLKLAVIASFPWFPSVLIKVLEAIAWRRESFVGGRVVTYGTTQIVELIT